MAKNKNSKSRPKAQPQAAAVESTVPSPANDIWSRFFAIRSVAELREFLSGLDPVNPAEAALLYYADSWFKQWADDVPEEFNPNEYLSDDLSAVQFGKCPVIFMGTNHWAEKPYRKAAEHEESASRFISNIKRLRKIYSRQKIAVALIPEKDYVINSMFLGGDRYKAIDAAIDRARRELAELDIQLIFDWPLHGLNKYMGISDFEYPDTHLSGKNYIQFFSKIGAALGIDRKEIDAQLSMQSVLVYGDLFSRMASSPRTPEESYLPHYPNAQIELVEGSKTFESPLGDTWQRLVNSNAIINDDILILGDSHSSILEQRRLTYLASGAFRRTDFYWNPCGVRTEVPETDASFVLLEISSRFIF